MTVRHRLTYFGIFSVMLLPALVFAQDDNSQSLGDIARKLHKDTTEEVRMTDAETKTLFESVDKIFDFAAEDSGMPKHASVKRRMVGKADVEKYASGRLAKEEYTQRFAESELSMKKLGYLPRDFNLREFLVKATGQEIAGYYDEETKTISLLNWVPSDKQEPILAHELTHALQDQNYDLHKWMRAASKASSPGSSHASQNDDGAAARKAVVEGQAMVVYVDYVLKPFNQNLVDNPSLIYSMEEPAVKAVQESQMMHQAPMILRESGSFAYNEGLIFEGELLHKGGRKMAFAGVFARPPHNSHEILQPEAYINNEKPPVISVPDMKQLIGEQYDVYDSGGIGQLDVRAYLKQYGESRNAEEVSAAWQGGAYVTFRRKQKTATVPAAATSAAFAAASAAAAPVASASTAATPDASKPPAPTTSDLALLYVSRWKTSQAAERFAKFYASSIPVRYQTATPQASPACSGTKCPVSSAQFLTEEGPVVVEHFSDNSVIVSESFDTNTAYKVRDAVRDDNAGEQANIYPQGEIATRLYEIPAFREYAAQIGDQFAQALTSAH